MKKQEEAGKRRHITGYIKERDKGTDKGLTTGPYFHRQRTNYRTLFPRNKGLDKGPSIKR